MESSDFTGRILVVDDDPLVAPQIRFVLRSFNHVVNHACSPAHAEEMMRTFAPDLIFLDNEMPGKKGMQFLAEIRSRQEFMFVPVIMLTRDELPGFKLSAIKEGVTDFIRKPFELEELVARVQALLKQKFLMDELEVAGNVIHSISDIIEARDQYTRGHGGRVALYAEHLGRHIGLRGRDLEVLKRGALFHDIGKIAIRDDVLLKPGRLTPEEIAHIKVHPAVGYDLLKSMKTLKDCLPIVRSHHEKLDGSGYPDGLSGSAISVPVRITSIVDVYDALTTTRPYRKSMTSEEAVRLIDEEVRKGWWDKKIFESFKQIMAEPPLTFSNPSLIPA